MRIVFINYTDRKGGAAIAANRLFKGLNQYHQCDNYFIVADKISEEENILSIYQNKLQRKVDKKFHKLTKRFGLQYQYFPVSSKYILNKTKELKPDIISLHNTHDGYFQTSILPELSKIAPVVWTLHDMWSFTGNCSYSFEDDSWKEMETGKNDKYLYPQIGINTGKWLLKQKKKIYENSDITFVTPSKWLQKLANQSPILNNKNIYQMFNGIDLNLFQTKNKVESRKILNIPINSKVILFNSDGLFDDRKGGNLLVNILNMISTLANEEISILTIGNGNLNLLENYNKFNIFNAGFVKDEEMMVTCFSAADLFIFPTKADNLPNVLIESIACGTAAITFNVGGCGEIIKNDYNGCLIHPFDLKLFADKTMEILNKKEKLFEFSKNARKFCEENFSIEMMCDNYYNLFDSIINKKQ